MIDKGFIFGLAMGMLGGMILIKNCKETSQLYDKGQKAIEKVMKKTKNNE